MYNVKSQWNSILLLMNMLEKELKQHIFTFLIDINDNISC